MTTATRRPRLAAVSLLTAALGLFPGLSQAALPEGAVEDAGPDQVVAEALFLHDCLPPGSRDLNLAVALQRGEADPATGARGWEAWPRVQLAMPLGERAGFTAEVGIEPSGESLDTPAASLKVLLREPGLGRTGVTAALDLLGSAHSLADAETGLGVGAIRSVGAVTFRGAATLATAVASWTPHFHGGLSAAFEMGRRWRALGELVAEVAGGEVAYRAGPTFKVELGESTSLMAGALFPVGSAGGDPVVTVQLTQGI